MLILGPKSRRAMNPLRRFVQLIFDAHKFIREALLSVKKDVRIAIEQLGKFNDAPPRKANLTKAVLNSPDSTRGYIRYHAITPNEESKFPKQFGLSDKAEDGYLAPAYFGHPQATVAVYDSAPEMAIAQQPPIYLRTALGAYSHCKEAFAKFARTYLESDRSVSALINRPTYFMGRSEKVPKFFQMTNITDRESQREHRLKLRRGLYAAIGNEKPRPVRGIRRNFIKDQLVDSVGFYKASTRAHPRLCKLQISNCRRSTNPEGFSYARGAFSAKIKFRYQLAFRPRQLAYMNSAGSDTVSFKYAIDRTPSYIKLLTDRGYRLVRLIGRDYLQMLCSSKSFPHRPDYNIISGRRLPCPT